MISWLKKQISSVSNENNLTPEITEPEYPQIDNSCLEDHDSEWNQYIQYFEGHSDLYTANPLPSHKELRMLIITDTHGRIYNTSIMSFIQNRCSVSDVILLLGDFSFRDLERLTMVLPYKKTFGILGDQDLKNIYHRFGIQTLGQTIIDVNGFLIAGVDGSIKYKEDKNYCLLTHTESIEITKQMKPAHILISHDQPYFSELQLHPHQKGLVGLSTYIYKNHVPLNIHGHLHNQNKYFLPNDCLCLGLVLAAFVQIVDGVPMITHFQSAF